MSKSKKSKKSKKSQKSQNWFTRLFSSNSNNTPLSKKKSIADKWCKKQVYKGDTSGRCNVNKDLCKCEDDGWFEPIDDRFRWKFGFNSIKYNKSEKCNKKWGQGRRSSGCSPKIDYKKMKV
jgi:hypothetical protein